MYTESASNNFHKSAERGAPLVSRLARIFELLESAGLRFLPVPGTKWYKIYDAEGREVFLKEKEIIDYFGDVEANEMRARFLQCYERHGASA